MAQRGSQRALKRSVSSTDAEPRPVPTNDEAAVTSAHGAPDGRLVPVLYRVPEAMALLRMSRTVIYELIRAGRLRTVKEGTARRIPAAAITEYLALLDCEAAIGEAA